MEVKNIAIITGNGDFVTADDLLAMLNAGVTEFVEGDESLPIEKPTATVGFEWE